MARVWSSYVEPHMDANTGIVSVRIGDHNKDHSSNQSLSSSLSLNETSLSNSHTIYLKSNTIINKTVCAYPICTIVKHFDQYSESVWHALPACSAQQFLQNVCLICVMILFYSASAPWLRVPPT